MMVIPAARGVQESQQAADTHSARMPIGVVAGPLNSPALLPAPTDG